MVRKKMFRYFKKMPEYLFRETLTKAFLSPSLLCKFVCIILESHI